MALREYLTTEVAEDWVDGLISRREALSRLALLGLSMSASSALLDACAQQGTGTPPAAVTGPPGGSAPAPGGSAPASGGSATSSVGSSAPLSGEAIRFAGPRGELQGFLSTAASPKGAMLVIHENRGLTDHIRSVASRLAADGYTSLAIDLLSEEGGTAAVGDGNVQAALASAGTDRLVADMKAGVDELTRRAPGAGIGVTGFCFGGGMVWALLNAGEPRLAAAVPFYGPGPDAPDLTGNKAAVFAIYAELDDRVNASRDRMEGALKAAGLTYQVRTYPGVDHAFFNDTGGRYNAEQAKAAYADMLAWLGTHVAG
jgi:carboxymethylenebutenolidase